MKEIDWEQVRIQAAIAAMQGFCANSNIYSDAAETANMSIQFADALITELKK